MVNSIYIYYNVILLNKIIKSIIIIRDKLIKYRQLLFESIYLVIYIKDVWITFVIVISAIESTQVHQSIE